ncbi:MAG: hypothetical protein HKP61_01260 [Dactylosporangium sp.]|nr:hypothetical protein [Dactylosporangium sp.]NNJ59598.1 hypothetical protein [Dactylosporangium sp.]
MPSTLIVHQQADLAPRGLVVGQPAMGVNVAEASHRLQFGESLVTEEQGNQPSLCRIIAGSRHLPKLGQSLIKRAVAGQQLCASPARSRVTGLDQRLEYRLGFVVAALVRQDTDQRISGVAVLKTSGVVLQFFDTAVLGEQRDELPAGIVVPGIRECPKVQHRVVDIANVEEQPGEMPPGNWISGLHQGRQHRERVGGVPGVGRKAGKVDTGSNRALTSKVAQFLHRVEIGQNVDQILLGVLVTSLDRQAQLIHGRCGVAKAGE